ncbi:MAG: GerW family sporulation protein [Acutalibacteraceae bacterium]
MGNHPIDGMLGTTMEKIKEMVDVDSVIGKPITTPDGTTVIPISKVSYGFASGGSDFPAKSQPEKDFFGGGAGAGITITPIAFLSICNGDVKLIQVEPFEGSADRIIQMVPDVVDKISETFSKKKEERAAKKEEKKAAKELEKLKEKEE